jgi:GNAT superfamily N-acetyltransferase
MELFMDRALSRRLERTEASINASFIEARTRLAPEVSAAWTDVGGAYLLFDGLGSPMTQSFGLGLWEPVTAERLSTIEAFFLDRGSDVFHEVSPLAGAATFTLLSERGYRAIELTTVLVQPLAGGAAEPSIPPDLTVRVARPDEATAWVETSVTGWGERPELADHIRKVATVMFHNPAVLSFVAERGGVPIATGALGLHEGTALLAGASTVPAERGRGAQRALLAARLAEARRRGCTAAVMGAEPGSTSQRNAERNGFRVAYTRTKWQLARPGAA